MQQYNNGPEKEIRAGAVSISVWHNKGRSGQGGSFDYKTVSVSKRYQQNNQWKTTSSFRLEDIPKLITLLQEIYKHLLLNDKDLIELQAG